MAKNGILKFKIKFKNAFCETNNAFFIRLEILNATVQLAVKTTVRKYSPRTL